MRKGLQCCLPEVTRGEPTGDASGRRSGGKATAKGIYPKIHYETRQLKLANFFKEL
jgi:hypothetical protein